MFNDVKKQAYEQFKIAVNQESIERMADDIHMYGRQSPELDRLEQLAEVFHEHGNPANIETYRTLRRHSLQYRDIDDFMALTGSQYNWFDNLDMHNNEEKKPALRVVC